MRPRPHHCRRRQCRRHSSRRARSSPKYSSSCSPIPVSAPRRERRRAELLRGGLQIYTTIDPVAQARALDAIHSVVPDQPPFTAALVSIDPNTGYVRAAASGVDFGELQYDLTTHLPGRQPGSTYKVITLAAALEAGYSPNDTVDGTSPCTASAPGLPVWNTENAEPGGGIITLRQATSGLGELRLRPRHREPRATRRDRHGPPTGDHAADSRLPPDHARSEGSDTVGDGHRRGDARRRRRSPRSAVHRTGRRVTTARRSSTTPTRRGRTSSRRTSSTARPIMLHGVITGGTGTAAALEGRDAAGKTGTTDDHGDAWFLGFTPQLATVVWMGAPEGRIPMTDVGGIEVFGGTYPAEVWKAFMDAQLADQPAVDAAGPGPGVRPAGREHHRRRPRECCDPAAAGCRRRRATTRARRPTRRPTIPGVAEPDRVPPAPTRRRRCRPRHRPRHRPRRRHRRRRRRRCRRTGDDRAAPDDESDSSRHARGQSMFNRRSGGGGDARVVRDERRRGGRGHGRRSTGSSDHPGGRPVAVR